MRKMLLVGTVVTISALLLTEAVRTADCVGNTAPCFTWGPTNGGTDPGPYPGYCCRRAVRSISYGPDEYGYCRDRKNDVLAQCGD